MADTSPLDGSNLKSNRKDPHANIMPVSSTQQQLAKINANGNSADNRNDVTKNKKCSTVKCEKFGKSAVNNKESVTNTLVALATTKSTKSTKTTTTTTTATAIAKAVIPPSSISVSVSVSALSVLKPTTVNSHQQQRMNQTQCQHQNMQKMNKQKMQSEQQDQQTLMDLQEIDDLRKKRCADRYDSSESSDSGVATLSITDSSATSSEDASNPDSPDNPTINNDLLHHLNGSKCLKQNQQVPNNNNNSNHTKNKHETISNAPPLALAWPWNVNSQTTSDSSSNAPPPLTLSKSSILSENKTNSSNNSRNKRNHTPDTVDVTVNKRNRTSNSNVLVNSSMNNTACETDATNNRIDSKRTSIQNTNGLRSSATITSGINVSNGTATPNIRSQTKITGFFKTQMKALPSLRKDLTSVVVRPTTIPQLNSQQKDESKILCETSTLNGISTKIDTLPSSSSSSSSSSSLSSLSSLSTLSSVSTNGGSVTANAPLVATATALSKKVERKTAKVSPISRKSNAMKKSYANVLPKKHVNIAPRTNTTSMTVSSIGLPSMADSMKSQQTKVMQSIAQQRLHVKYLKRQMEFGGQTDYGVLPLLTTIHLPGTGTAQTQTQHHQHQHQHQHQQPQQQNATLNAVQSNQSLQAQKNLPQTQKPNGAIYQLHPTSVIQIPVATKETNPQTANNIVVNNGYFINGAFIKLQQMLTPAATGVDQQFHRQIKEAQPQSNSIQNMSEQQMPMSQKPTFSQQSNGKLAPASALVSDAQALTNHNDLTQHFVANGPSNAQFAQQVFIPTSSGLLLTTALPTMLTSQIQNLQPLSQQPMATALHQVTDKSSIAVSIDKRPCINMQLPQQTLAVTLPPDNNIQSNFLPNNFTFGVNATATVPMNQTIVSDKGPNAFNRPNLLSSVTIAQPFTSQKIATTSTNTLSLPVTFSLSAPPPLCVQSKEMVQSSNHLSLSNSQISFANSNSTTTMTASVNAAINCVGNKVLNGNDAGQKETVNSTENHDSKVNSKTIDISLDTCNLTDSISNNISTKQISSVRDTRDSQQNDLKTIPALVAHIQHDKQTDRSDKLTSMSTSTLIAPVQVTVTTAIDVAATAAAAIAATVAATAAADSIIKKPITSITITDSMLRTTELDTVLINNASLPECSKSPILSQPKTIRFPANGSRHANDRRTSTHCYWDDCNENCETSSNLLDHLQTKHVNPQAAPFSCHWANCKVHSRESCSRKWLERHVLSHGGSKLFKCIFEKCRMRFGSQLALQKHVNGHINNNENNKDSTVRRSSDPPVPKKLRVNGKRLRYRRQPFSARMFDYFDNGVMEELQHRLLHTVTITNGLSEAITFKGRSIGRRVTANGSVELLIKWNPSDIISDEWMSANKTSFIKTVQLTALSQSERISLMEHMNYLYKFPTNIFPSSSINSSSNTNESYTTDEISKKS